MIGCSLARMRGERALLPLLLWEHTVTAARRWVLATAGARKALLTPLLAPALLLRPQAGCIAANAAAMLLLGLLEEEGQRTAAAR